jgi:hypothetical protein
MEVPCKSLIILSLYRVCARDYVTMLKDNKKKQSPELLELLPYGCTEPCLVCLATDDQRQAVCMVSDSH